ncbi:hypothetical protein THAOC_25277, partial [Thalassiosira oceanica]
GAKACDVLAAKYPYIPLTAEISAVRGLTAEISAVRVEHESDASVAHPRPGYRSRSITGPTAVDQRRLFGRDPCNGRKIRPDRGAPRPARRACSASGTLKHDAARFPPPLFADTDVAVHEVPRSTSGGSPTPLFLFRMAQRT